MIMDTLSMHMIDDSVQGGAAHARNAARGV
jgi:hypothetical protein